MEMNKTLIALLVGGSLALTGCGGSSSSSDSSNGGNTDAALDGSDSGNSEPEGGSSGAVSGEYPSEGLWLTSFETTTVFDTGFGVMTTDMDATIPLVFIRDGDHFDTISCEQRTPVHPEEDDEDTCESTTEKLEDNHWRVTVTEESDDCSPGVYHYKKISNETAFNFGELNVDFVNAADVNAVADVCASIIKSHTVTTGDFPMDRLSNDFSVVVPYQGEFLTVALSLGGSTVEAGEYSFDAMLAEGTFSAYASAKPFVDTEGAEFMSFMDGDLTVESVSKTAIKVSFSLQTMDGNLVTGDLNIVLE